MSYPRWFVVDDDGGSEAAPQCFYADPLPYAPEWDNLVDDLANPQVDLYGFLGFPSGRLNDDIVLNDPANWEICPFVDYCDGPEVEGDTQPFRYVTRWTARLDPTATGDQRVMYGRTGEAVQPANPLLFPALLGPDATWITIGFDANALAGFAFQYDNAGTPTIEVRRLIAGVPTTFTWAGVSPRLFFDGILQRDPALTDLICFYVNLAGQLCGRFQRENMAIEHVLGTTGLEGGIQNLTKTDRDGSYQRIYYIAGNGDYRMYRSAVYPPFPIYGTDLLSYGLGGLTGLYLPAITPGGSYADLLSYELGELIGAYVSGIVPSGPYSDLSSYGLDPLSGDYTTIIVIAGGDGTDLSSYDIGVLTGAYIQTIVSGGAYADLASYGIGELSGTYV